MVTMRDVAALAGVSQATVSYALNGDPIITESTRAKVLTAARKLNYTVNLSARNLKSGKSGALGLVVQELQNPYVTQLADAVSQYALTKHMQTVIQQTLYRQENETSILEHVTSAFCDAVIFSPSKLTSKQIKSQLNGKPALLLSSRDSNPEYDVLDTPAREAMYTATSYLLETGCRKLLFMGMPYIPLNECLYSVDSARLRIAGFEQALVEHGIEPSPSQFIQPGGWNPAISRAAMLEYLDQHAAPKLAGIGQTQLTLRSTLTESSV
ncbi:hypothetical protein KIM372_16020 [Bombiscardovia nodaiensis]|uniref:HTH lacI-type domain-containing protein n=1 Tax=Bombiscardovia nodaiensis TaxID=2932181 RepID=A0ABM8B9Z5_9BIFI|nr:hypothetical protein KIM372_16020 [Bombiscardovia nodaiensis]